MILARKGARSSADQSIGLRSQGSWVRIPPGAPKSSNFRPEPEPKEHLLGGDPMKAASIRYAAVALAFAAGSALAQQYPTKSVTMMVPFAAGGPTDTVARVVAQAMAKPM